MNFWFRPGAEQTESLLELFGLCFEKLVCLFCMLLVICVTGEWFFKIGARKEISSIFVKTLFSSRGIWLFVTGNVPCWPRISILRHQREAWLQFEYLLRWIVTSLKHFFVVRSLKNIRKKAEHLVRAIGVYELNASKNFEKEIMKKD